MTAAARTRMNQQNATHSTGPRTEGGKQRSKWNALSHGLASTAVVLPWESKEEYEAMKQSFGENHAPGSDIERELLARMVDCWWRLQRAYRVESHFLAQREQAIAADHDGLAGDSALAMMFADPKEMARMRLFMRYLAAAERAWNRALAEFQKAKKERLKAAANDVIAQAMQYLEPQPANEAGEIGFVPYNEDEVMLPGEDLDLYATGDTPADADLEAA